MPTGFCLVPGLRSCLICSGFPHSAPRGRKKPLRQSQCVGRINERNDTYAEPRCPSILRLRARVLRTHTSIRVDSFRSAAVAPGRWPMPEAMGFPGGGEPGVRLHAGARRLAPSWRSLRKTRPTTPRRPRYLRTDVPHSLTERAQVLNSPPPKSEQNRSKPGRGSDRFCSPFGGVRFI